MNPEDERGDSSQESLPPGSEAGGLSNADTVFPPSNGLGITGETSATRDGASEQTSPGQTLDFPPQPRRTDDTELVQATVPPEAGRLIEAPGTAGKVPGRVGGYEIVEVLGRGSMGVVYKARQVGLGRLVALKMILSGDHANPHELARFRAEAEAVARLRHVNIVQIYEVGEEGDRPYFSLEYVEGGSLERKMAATPQPPREAARLVQTLAAAMDYAHQQGIIHRDLKPANILLTADGVPKISDFGLAKRLEGDAGQTHSGTILGTPSYMAPEQALGMLSAIGPPADVYALGAILYELLTGRVPFRGPTILETLEQVRSREPIAPGLLQPRLPRDLETICLKCLHKDPRKRYERAADLAGDLGRYLRGEPIRARPVPPWERAWRWCRRNPIVAGLSAALALLLVATLAGSLAFSAVVYQEKTATEQARLEAEENARQAEQNMIEAQENARTARANEEKARKNAEVALDRQYAGIRHVAALARQVQKKLRHAGNGERESVFGPLRNDLLQTMRQHLLGMAKEIEGTDITLFSSAHTHTVLGDLFRDLGLGSEAMKQYQQAHDSARTAALEHPEEDRGRANWGLLMARLGDMEIELRGDVARARDLYRQALEKQQDVEDHPQNHFYSLVDHQRIKANYHFKLGAVHTLCGDPEEARKSFTECVRLRRLWLGAEPTSLPARGYLAEAVLWLGDVCGRLEDEEAMRAGFKEGIDLVKGLLADKLHHDFQADLAESYLMYGYALCRLRKYDEARSCYEQCPPLLGAALGKDPESIRYLDLAARLHYARGLIARQTGDVRAAERFADALRWRQKAAAIDTESLRQQTILLACLARTGKTADAAARAEVLRPRLAKNPELLVRLAGVYALCAAASPDARERYTSQALTLLGGVVEAGYRDRVYLRSHPDLQSLADLPAFQKLRFAALPTQKSN
jgi:serine/threonine-protein kinase